MKIIDVITHTNKPVVTQYQPGTGFTYKLTNDCSERGVKLLQIDAHLVDVSFTGGYIETRELLDRALMECRDMKALLLINDFDTLTEKRQLYFFNKLSQKVSNNVSVVITTSDLEKINPEVLEKSFLFLDAKLSNSGVDSSGLPGQLNKEAIEDIRKKGQTTKSTLGEQKI